MELTLEKLEEDKVQLEQSFEQAKAQLYRIDGALSYVNDNIKKLKEEEDDRTGIDNEGS